VKLYLDEDLSPRIAERLRKKGIDAVSVFEVGRMQMSDREQLAYAAQEGRCLVTRNARHFIILAREAIRRQEPHAGVILCSPRMRGVEVGAIANALLRTAMRFPKGLGEYDVLYL
jgi:predicted nuclease of predicted toxin-antitoxin system